MIPVTIPPLYCLWIISVLLLCGLYRFFLMILLLHVCVKWDPTCLENYAFGHLPGGGWVGCAGPWGVDATLRILIFNITSYPTTISSSQLCIVCGIFLSIVFIYISNLIKLFLSSKCPDFFNDECNCCRRRMKTSCSSVAWQ